MRKPKFGLLLSLLSLSLSFVIVASVMAQTPAKPQPHPQPHPMTLDDAFRVKNVANPKVSPDGNWVLYTVSSVDLKKDDATTVLWMVSWDGKQDVQLTYDYNGSVGSPEWSPDGKYISFSSGRKGNAEGTQVWVLNRSGGEARQLTNVTKEQGKIAAYEWSPDGTQLLLTVNTGGTVSANEFNDTQQKKYVPPIVITRYLFKQDMIGYITADSHTFLYLYDIATGTMKKLTAGNKYDERDGMWSPDGKEIAFISNHTEEPERNINTDVFVVAAKPGSEPRQLTHYTGADTGPLAWSPDGREIAFLRGGPVEYWQYQEDQLATIPADGSSHATVVTRNFDRPIRDPQWTPDGKHIIALVSDDRNGYPASIDVATGAVQRLVETEGVSQSHSAKAGHEALLWTTDTQPDEVYALRDGDLRQLTHQNATLLSELVLAKAQNMHATSKDGTRVDGLITMPDDAGATKPYPMLLWIHGGPQGQDAHEFSAMRQLFAARGYAVLNVNYRGSNGRGLAYQKAIWANWGVDEVQDVEACVNEVVREGIVDPKRMGVGGWSYGGITTDYMIASTDEFKAATSGAGTGDPLVLYGVDEYINQYNFELGPPWKNQQTYIKLAYPLLHADRIRTPTLFMGGTSDFNVPLVAGEQMYEALQTLHVPSALIVYPQEFHGFKRPAYIRDRYQYWFNWYDKWVLGKDVKLTYLPWAKEEQARAQGKEQPTDQSKQQPK
ncbi:MAG TPA: S9 family peptidase [Candidatus Acidoferrum sp.]|nr:S9 family peptidase [Candidatus Acidoferrum sp.]